MKICPECNSTSVTVMTDMKVSYLDRKEKKAEVCRETEK